LTKKEGHRCFHLRQFEQEKNGGTTMPVDVQSNKDDLQFQLTDRSGQLHSLWQMADKLHELFFEVLREWMRVQQQRQLEARLGKKWQPLPPAWRRISCPGCGSVAVRRKCWRERTVTLARWGEVSVPRRQLACTDCGRTWMPFAEQLELPRGRYGPDLLEQTIGWATEVSFQKASEAHPEAPSAHTIWRRLRQTVPTPPCRRASTAGMDATDVPEWQGDGQQAVSLVHGIGPASEQRTEPRPRRVLAVAAGDEADIKPKLTSLHLQSLIHDGNLALEGAAEQIGRCRWHVPYTVRHLLYKDDITGEDNKERVQQLHQITTDPRLGKQTLAWRLNLWLMENSDAPQACEHVRRARPGLMELADRKSRRPAVETTSHVEREMLEINKRFENGGGWTRRGAKAMLLHHQMRRHEPDNWKRQLREKLETTLLLN
jgi:RNase P subunit RPR2